jgi:uncharacterized membrane protein YbhN (UPF0104 family)
LRPLAGVGLFGLVVVEAVRNWDSVSSTVGQMSPLGLAGALALAFVGLASSVLVWRCALGEVGTVLPISSAANVYLVGQLGKYLPGSVWAFVVQMERGRQVGLTRLRTLAASVLAVGFNLVTGAAVGIFAVPSIADGARWRYAVVAAVLVACAVTLNPPALRWSATAGLRLLGRTPIAVNVSWRGIGEAISWSLLGWAAYGTCLWVLVLLAGGPALESLPLCFAGIALAMIAGFVIVLAPSGIGVREAVLVAVLAPVLDHGPALAIALILRLLFTIADLVSAAGIVVLRPRPARSSASPA